MIEKSVKGELTKSAGSSAPPDAWLKGVAAWLLPGAGHMWQGRWARGLLLGGAVWAMFLIGMALGGHLFDLSAENGASLLLQVPPMIANMGAGILYFFCYLTNLGFTEQAERATFEYGNTFLLAAGLLNYLAVLDAFDIAAGRKD